MLARQYLTEFRATSPVISHPMGMDGVRFFVNKNAFESRKLHYSCNKVRFFLLAGDIQAELQLRKSEQNGFHSHFLSQPNPMM